MQTEHGGESPVQLLFPDEVAAYLETHAEGTYTLLDVRQPGEYEEGHLPGALLIPLPELADSLDQLDRQRPVIAYCAVGGRSRMAAELLAHQGFPRVYHLVGGMEAWEGRAAAGPPAFHLQFLHGDEGVAEILTLAYKMEWGLFRFHRRTQESCSDAALDDLLASLLKAEEAHMHRLLAEAPRWDLDPEAIKAAAAGAETIMEGGLDPEAFFRARQEYLQTAAAILEVAMMIETQALDLYLRLATICKDDDARQLLYRIGEEEKGHLAALGRLLEEKASGRERGEKPA